MRCAIPERGKRAENVPQLALYDIVNTPGVAADLSHISTPAKVEGFPPNDDGLSKALKGADVVVIPAGVPRKPGVRYSPRCPSRSLRH